MKFWGMLPENQTTSSTWDALCVMREEQIIMQSRMFMVKNSVQKEWGCQFHFKNSVKQQSNKMSNDDQGTFKHICKKLCEVTTVAMYYFLKGCLDEMSKKYEFLEPWIDWCHERHSNIFCPFRGGGLPGINLSEQGNSKWVRQNTTCLVHAAHDDVAWWLYKKRLFTSLIETSLDLVVGDQVYQNVMSWPNFRLCNSSQQNCLLIWLNYNIKLKSILFFSILTYIWQK